MVTGRIRASSLSSVREAPPHPLSTRSVSELRRGLVIGILPKEIVRAAAVCSCLWESSNEVWSGFGSPYTSCFTTWVRPLAWERRCAFFSLWLFNHLEELSVFLSVLEVG